MRNWLVILLSVCAVSVANAQSEDVAPAEVSTDLDQLVDEAEAAINISDDDLSEDIELSEFSLKGLRLGVGGDWIAAPTANTSVYGWTPSLGLEAGLDFEKWAAVVEWRHQATKSEEGNFSIRTVENQALFWVRMNLTKSRRWLTWAQAGAGNRWAQVTTSIGGTRARQSTDPDFVIGAGAGAGWEFASQWRLDILAKALKPQSRFSWEFASTLGISRTF